MKALAHRAPTLQPVIVQINVDISLVFWPLFALAWLGWLGLAGVGRVVKVAWDSPLKSWLFDDWDRDWRMICEAVRLLFVKEVQCSPV
jgi:hypothetical protein